MKYIEEELLDIEINDYLNEKSKQIINEILANYQEIAFVNIKLDLTYDIIVNDRYTSGNI